MVSYLSSFIEREGSPQRRATKMIRGLEHFCEERLSWGCSAWRRESCRRTYGSLSVLKGSARKLERDFLQGPVAIGQGVTALI